MLRLAGRFSQLPPVFLLAFSASWLRIDWQTLFSFVRHELMAPGLGLMIPKQPAKESASNENVSRSVLFALTMPMLEAQTKWVRNMFNKNQNNCITGATC